MSGPSERPGASHGAAARIASVKWRLLGLFIVACFYLGLWICVAAGATWLEAPLLTIPVLVVLIAGGNWLQHWLGVTRRAPQFSRPGTDDGREEPSSP